MSQNNQPESKAVKPGKAKGKGDFDYFREYFRNPGCIDCLPGVSSSAKLILSHIKDAFRDKDSAYPSIKLLSLETGCAPSTVYEAESYLESVGLLEVDRDGYGSVNHYRLGPIYTMLFDLYRGFKWRKKRYERHRQYRAYIKAAEAILNGPIVATFKEEYAERAKQRASTTRPEIEHSSGTRPEIEHSSGQRQRQTRPEIEPPTRPEIGYPRPEIEHPQGADPSGNRRLRKRHLRRGTERRGKLKEKLAAKPFTGVKGSTAETSSTSLASEAGDEGQKGLETLHLATRLRDGGIVVESPRGENLRTLERLDHHLAGLAERLADEAAEAANKRDSAPFIPGCLTDALRLLLEEASTRGISKLEGLLDSALWDSLLHPDSREPEEEPVLPVEEEPEEEPDEELDEDEASIVRIIEHLLECKGQNGEATVAEYHHKLAVKIHRRQDFESLTSVGRLWVTNTLGIPPEEKHDPNHNSHHNNP